jgi:hypothetical protein
MRYPMMPSPRKPSCAVCANEKSLLKNFEEAMILAIPTEGSIRWAYL